jgi:hypothetical protein
MIYADLKLPDIALYLQDYIDITYVMQKTVFPRIDRFRDLKIDYKRPPLFTGIYDEYDKYLNNLFCSSSLFFLCCCCPQTAKQKKAIYFLCHAALQMTFFECPNKYDLRTPNRIDISMLSGLPADRENKAKNIIKTLFAIDKYGNLIYNPEIIQQNHFAIFRDNRTEFNIKQDSNV